MSFSFFAGRKQNKKNTNAFLRRTLRLEELESRQLLSVSWARVTDSAGYDNYLEASSTDTVWNCGTLSTPSDSMIVLQTEEQTAEIVLQGKTDDTAGPIVWKFNDESAGEYWSQTFGSVNANFFSESLVWTATGKTSPSRDFSITIWHDLNGDNLLNATESAKTLNVRIAWANVSVCTDQPEAGSTAPAVFSNYVTGSLLTAILNNNDINTCVSCDVGHSYWDFRGSNSLITGSSTLSSNLGNLINKSWGYSADTQSSPVEMLLNSGNIVAPGICHEETAPTSDAYATYWIDSMSDYVAMLTYTQDTIANPGNYVLLPDSDHATSHQCTDVVLGLLDAGGIELNLQRQTNVEVPIPANLVSDLKELFDYPVYGPGIRASYPWLYNFIVTNNNTSFLYNGYSPANLGETLVANGGTRGQFSAVSDPATTETGDSVQQLPAPNFNAPTIGSKSVTMSWNNVANSSGYVLQWRLSTTGAIQGTKTLSGNTTTSCVVSGLLPATGYTFNVMATSSNPAYSNSNWSFNYLVTTNSAGYTPGDESAVAPVLYSDAVYSTAATFHWSAVSGAVSYVLQYYAKYPVKTDPVELSYSKAGTYTVSGLEKGTQYVFTLWGVKSDGSETTHSFPVYITTNSAGITLPIHIDSPLLQTVEPTGDSTISVSWSTVQDAAWYVLEYSTNSAFKTGTVVS
ncbi:MAG: fibronectin type III domain-containing protein, partial [Thermoguttaceae bacterium]|nr:fibronectin type III domain-containing protein [Thermoguttaceae bacterium]